MVGDKVSHFRIEAKIGRGGMGEVFKAYDTRLDRPVALKRLRPDLALDREYRRQFIREARSAARINHSGIAAIYDIVEEDGDFYLVMEYLEGRNLNQANLRRSDIESILDIAEQCAEAVAAAHERGVIHRDLKPSNIMLTPEGKAKILDFGLAKKEQKPATKLGSEDSTTEVTTERDRIKGTLIYMAPEVLTGHPADHRSDLFSLGVVFYELFTGRHPFLEKTRPLTLSRILGGSPLPMAESNPWIPQELETIIFSMLEKDPKYRRASAEDVASGLRRIRRTCAPTPVPPLPLPDPRPWWRRHTTLLAVLVLSAVAASVLTWKFFLPPRLLRNPTLVVMPFSAEAGDSELEAFAAGLGEMVNGKLAALSLESPFKVIPSDMTRLRNGIKINEIGIQLGADVALLGDVEESGGRLTIDLRLVDPVAGVLRRSLVEGIQDQPADLEYAVTEGVLGLLEVPLGPSERRLLTGYGRSSAAHVFFLRGLGHLIRKNSKDAADRLQKALGFDDQFGLAEANLGLALIAQAGFPEERDRETLLTEAAMHCQAALQGNSQLAMAHYCLGEVQLERELPEEALSSFLAAFHHGTLRAEVLDRLLLVLGRLGREEELIPLFQSAVQRYPDLWLTHSYLGYAYWLLDQLELTIEEQKRKIELAPTLYGSYIMLAVCYDRLGCPDQALEAYRVALEIQRRDSVFVNQATTYFYAGLYKEALESASQAIAFQTGTIKDHRLYIDQGNLADIQYWSPGGDRERGLQSYQLAVGMVDEYLKEQPGDPEAVRGRAWYLAMLGEQQDALQCLETVLEAGEPDCQTAYKAALVYQRLGQTELAMTYLRRSLELGKLPQQVRNEPIFREDPAFENLLADFPDNSVPCPQRLQEGGTR